MGKKVDYKLISMIYSVYYRRSNTCRFMERCAFDARRRLYMLTIFRSLLYFFDDFEFIKLR